MTETAAAGEAAAAIAAIRGFPAPAGPLDLIVARGDIVLLTGPNGSGKTSLLRSLAGLSAPLAPVSASVQGRDPAVVPARVLADDLVAMVLQEPRETLVGLTVHGEFSLRRRPVPPVAQPWTDRDVATLSSGEARTISLAVARPGIPLLLLDEPTEGLDAGRRSWLSGLVKDAAGVGAVVVADHSGLLAPLATRIVKLGVDGTRPPTLHHRAPAVASSSSVVKASAMVARRGESRVPLPAVSFPAGLHAIAGRNGSGKSTLLLRLAGLHSSEGVQVQGVPPVPGRNVRLLLPGARDLFTQATVEAELAGGETMGTGAGFVDPGLLGRHPLSLSAGEAQRVALAKTFGRSAPLYLLDEPEAHLDSAGRSLLMAAIDRLVAEGCCIVAATHAHDLLAACDSVLELPGP